jgi:hypothetical protein
MKDQRNPNKWSNTEIEQDSEGYVEAQRAFREDQEAAERQRRDADDERRFTAEFIRNGGRAGDAPAAFRKQRNEQAAQAAAQADASAEQASRRSVRQAL